jgi:HlyD family secretion protein
VKTGISGELMVEVVTGIQPGEEVITGPFKALRQIKDGDRVKRMSDKERKAAEAEGAGAS